MTTVTQLDAFESLRKENQQLHELVRELYETIQGITGNAERALKLASDRLHAIRAEALSDG
jgi:hypothetical protein